MTTVLIAKSAVDAKNAKFSPKIVLCPENPNIEGAQWNPTVLFNEVLFKPCGEWIPEAHDRKTKHVAKIQTMAIALALEAGDSNIAILSADVTPPDGWIDRLDKLFTSDVGMAAGFVPTGMGSSVKAWHLSGRPMDTRDNLGIEPYPVEAAALDCCVLTPAAARAIIPLSGDVLTETEIGRRLAAAGLKIVLHPLVRCLHG